MPLASITPAEGASWAGGLVARGVSPSSVTRYLATLRSIPGYAVADGRIRNNVATGVKAPSGGQMHREGRFLTVSQLDALAQACTGWCGELVRVLRLGGLRWGELLGLHVGDLVYVPGRGLRLQRAVDLRHTAASVWPAAGADPKVVQRVLGHASAAMTMDLYGHLVDQNLWDAAKRVAEGVGGLSVASDATEAQNDEAPGEETGS